MGLAMQGCKRLLYCFCMGLYIDFPDGLNIGKAARLRNDYGAVDFDGDSFSDIPEGKVLVAVVENREGEPGMTMMSLDGKVIRQFEQENSFDAAAVIYDEREFEDTQQPGETRTIHKLLIDRDVAIRLVPGLADLYD